jgi:hypothetical protein
MYVWDNYVRRYVCIPVRNMATGRKEACEGVRNLSVATVPNSHSLPTGEYRKCESDWSRTHGSSEPQPERSSTGTYYGGQHSFTGPLRLSAETIDGTDKTMQVRKPSYSRRRTDESTKCRDRSRFPTRESWLDAYDLITHTHYRIAYTSP